MKKDSYSLSASFYDLLIEPMNSGLRKIAMRMLPPRPGMKVLDIGCGTGSHLKLYEAAECDLWGIDLSPSMLKVARDKLQNHALLSLGDGTLLPYKNASFDLVISMLMLHEISPPTRAAVLKEAHRILQSQGNLLIIDYSARRPKGLKGKLIRGLINLIEFLAGGEHFKNYKQFKRAGGILPAIRDIPFQLENQKVISGGNLGIFIFSPVVNKGSP